MDVIEAIKGRRSVRDYTEESVEDSVVKELIGLAVEAPSAVNQQPWSFVVIKDKALLGQISDAAKAFMLKSPFAARGGRYRDMLSDPNFHIFYHAPVLVVIGASDAGAWGVEDCALAAQNLMLGAYAKGLGTCWIGFAQGWLGTEDGKAKLGLPAEVAPVAPIILGHPRQTAAAVPRKTPDVHWL